MITDLINNVLPQTNKSPLNSQEKVKVKINKNEILKNLKADFEASKRLKSRNDSKINTWRREYNGELYGNEKKNRSKFVYRLIKKQSEWQHAGLVDPFVSTPDIIRAKPVTWEDKEVSPKIEILLNTQFCRQFDRFNFMNKAIKVLDQEGTVVIRTGWEYKEKVIKEQIFEEQPNPDFIMLQEQAMAIQANLEQIAPMVKESQNSLAMLEQQGLSVDQAVASGVIDPQVVAGTQQMMAEYSNLEQQLQALQEQLQSIPQTIEVPRIIERLKPVCNRPTAMVCRNEDIFIDPTCQDNMDNCQFVIYRYETDMTTLKRAGVYKNLDKVSHTLRDSEYVSKTRDDEGYDSSFEFSDIARKKVVVHEYWGNYDIDGDGEAEAIVCTWVNDVIIQLRDNPFPDKQPPFIVVPFNSIPFSLYGESNAELLSDTQKIQTAIIRGLIDNMAMSNNGQKGVRNGALDEYNRVKFLNGENFEFNGTPNDFYDGHFNEFPSSTFNMLQMLNAEAESITGVKNFYQGMHSNSLGSTATATTAIMDSAAARRLNIVRNIAENMVKPILRKWLAYDAEFLDEETQYRITNEEFIWLKRDDLGARIDIDLAISTSEDNKATASELSFLLQTIGPSEDPNLRKMIIADICDLYKKPELAKSIREYEPQPDPLAQRLQELQIQMLEAQIENERAKGGRAEIDSRLKEAKTKTELAKAANIESNTDSTDLDYLQKFYGVNEKAKQANALEMEAAKHKFNMDKENLKLLENIAKNKHI
ncbi:hypothetical protein CVIC8964_1287 [Campylobacter vicugnae]|uniref:Portal protein n=1 Tax=Campylobacter vicugnae TaxID=1660076 RepID=A0A1X9T2M8_9BACT|nr:hypothetical protein [Campylobacter sp. RM8964]ARR02676.1 hypothetical protein CVIC8964_1287 [Campylobacter sp. RM8964]